MGWNCVACGHLLKPAPEPYDELAKVLWRLVDKDNIFLPKGEPRVCVCENCGSKYGILQGEQPRIYLNSVVVCIDDGEEKEG